VNRERISAVIAALAVVGMGRIGWLHFVSEPLHEPRRERIDARYAPLLPFLRAGEIGYVSDRAPGSRPEAASAANRLYFQAQYALAPLVLRPNDCRAPLVVVNLDDPAHARDVLKAHDLVLVAHPAPAVAVARPR
jgi:hypothetical protein